MIISASYKTDIPAFYTEWFLNRFRAGYCKIVNAFNAAQHYTIPLTADRVDGFVFWTKNIGPFFNALDEVATSKIPFVVQYTINGYPQALESRVVDPDKSIGYAKEVARRFGLRTVVWRYDPILISDVTPLAFHHEAFSSLASKLEGATNEVVVSFAHFYAKSRRNLDTIAPIKWDDPPDEHKRELLEDLRAVAASHGIQLSICSQPGLRTPGTTEAKCIDAARLGDIIGRPFKSKIKGSRPDCRCAESKDIGDYDTCPHGCLYCYAVRNRDTALQHYRRHDPNAEYLRTPSHHPRENNTTQLRLV